PPQPSVTQIRLTNIKSCLAVTADSLEVLASGLKETSLEAISYTTKSLLKNVETIKQNKDECAQLLEQTHELLNAVLVTYLKSDTGVDLAPDVLDQIGKFTQTLHKVHTFVEAQQKGSKIKRLFRQGDLSTLLKGCQKGLQQGLDSFQIDTGKIMTDIAMIQRESRETHDEVLRLIETLSDADSEKSSIISRVYSHSHNSSTSVSMLPSDPKIFHGRNSELSQILQLFNQGNSRIAILGAGGMGKTALARVVLHHTQITATYGQHRHFVACDPAATKVEVAALIGAHLGLKPGKDFTRAVVQYFISGPPSLLILDNLETAWEPMECRKEIEEFLSLLTDVKHLALIVTMRGAERPAKVAWSHPFLPPLRPLEQDAARQMFIDIADDAHNPDEVDQVLALTDNMPLAISLLAHVADSEGCCTALSRWEEEKTSMISHGWDRKSNLDLSISLSLSSPRLKAFPHSQELLSLLSMLLNGLSDVELVQSKLPIDKVLGCKAALIGTSLAYSDSNKRLKVLVPIREYMMKVQPPQDDLIQPIRKYFQQLLELYKEYEGTYTASGTVLRISSNLANIQNVLEDGLKPDRPDL
ncbi:P-loop containing nucleoside triphosphate hydrolase protein, partial [Mycena polygramma]